MKYRTIKEVQKAMLKDRKNWRIPFMEFVDDMRCMQDTALIKEPFSLRDEKFDSLLASTIEYLCNEMAIATPDWVWQVPSCKEPWFVAGCENLKAISIAESPAFFRRRKIFVLENFLVRV